MAISTYNAKLKYGVSTASTEIKIKDFPQIMGKQNALETTTTTDAHQTYIPGIRQVEGSLDFTCNYDKTVMSTINALTAEQAWTFELSDGGKYSGSGLLSCYVKEGGVDEVVDMVVSIFPTSEITFSAS